MPRLLTKQERCRDCAALVSVPGCEYFCDELEKPCDEIENCPEWSHDPSVPDEKGS